MSDLFIDTPTATFSPCRRYRFNLWRYWGKGTDPFALFIGLNPSTADETNDDPTIRRCIGFAKQWGMGGLCMVNLFAFRATDPKIMKMAADPVGPGNDIALQAAADCAAVIVAAWGAHGTYLNRDAAVRERLATHHLHCFGKTNGGQPRHPLYLPKTSTLIDL